jgi:hypothetical protein
VLDSKAHGSNRFLFVNCFSGSKRPVIAEAPQLASAEMLWGDPAQKLSRPPTKRDYKTRAHQPESAFKEFTA